MYNMTAHILIDKEDIQTYEKILHDIYDSLEDKYSITHVTLQLEFKKISMEENGINFNCHSISYG